MKERVDEEKRENGEKKGRINSENDRKSRELALIKTAPSLLIAASITSTLWSKVVTSSCYLHTYTHHTED